MDKRMGVWKALLFIVAAVLGSLCSVPAVWAQIQGSVFVDCGSMASYVDSITNISWVPDAPYYITTGVNGNVSSARSIYPNFSEFTTVRYFPDTRAKNCYSFLVMPDSTYLIRGTFFYGYYDNGTKLPSFQMAIDGTIVANVTFDNATVFVYHEFMVASVSHVTFLCLLRDSSNSVPFISAISFSFLPAEFFHSDVSDSLYGTQRNYFETKYTLNFGGDGLVRYPHDGFDRYWFPIQGSNLTFIQSTSPLQSLVASKIVGPNNNLSGNPPETVMDTALTSSGNITITFPDNYSYECILSFYYAELNSTANASSRNFYFEVPGSFPGGILLNPYSNGSNSVFNAVVELYWYTPGTDIVLYPDQTVSSPLGPIVNALEFWEISTNWMATMTDDQDANAIADIQSDMNLMDWTGDPCVPVPYHWVTCTLDSNSVPLITAVNLAAYNLTGDISWGFGNLLNLIALNLSSNQLTGSIPPSIWHITTLNTLDLSKNSLSGNLITTSTTPCPENLQYLNLAGNNFSGTFPAQLFFCSFYHLEQVNCDNNSFSGILDMDILVEKYTSYLSNVLISILYNNISGLIPNNGTYSPILLGGNPCCNPTSEALYYAPFYCRYNSVGVLIPNLDKTHKLILIILSSTLSIFAILGGIVLMVIFWKYRTNAKSLQNIQKEFARQQVQPTLYSYNVLRVATKDFHPRNKLGQGGFGVVYKGILSDSTTVAVKHLTKSQQGVDDFLNEVIVIAGVRHRNLVKLKGCCVHGTQRFLVFEYMENNNLAEALWDQQGQQTLLLDWPKRLNICVGVARGLAYLHEDSHPRIIHRDIKAANILLDKNMNAKIADFGLARLFPDDQSHISTQIAGTIGYLAPEYATLGQLTPKADVYSFGVLLLEIVSGRKNIDSTLAPNQIYLIKWALFLYESNMLTNLVEETLDIINSENEVRRVINVALLCVQIEPTIRPLMSHVLAMLQGEMDIDINIIERKLHGTNPNFQSILDDQSHRPLCESMSINDGNILLMNQVPNNNSEIELNDLQSR
ncbi:hypothetical protein BDL97_17G101000 [Sphagnum fallax]|nr:hypothetical protein BDL97_17G101000 [Sphagnum fallax]